MNRSVIVVASICLLVTFSSCEKYQEYKPLAFNGHGLVEKPELMTTQHIENLKQVLEYYGEEWTVVDGKFLISSSIDEELMWNYTRKANDSTWLVTHKPGGE